MLARDTAAVYLEAAPGVSWRDLIRCAVLVALLLLASALTGCASPAERFVAAYAQYRAEIGREHEENLDRIVVPDVDPATGLVKLRPLTDEEKVRRRRVHAAADDLISKARGGR